MEERMLEVYLKGIVHHGKQQEAQTGAFQLGMQKALSIAGIKIPDIND
ncbi:hypothetical protein JOD82_002075 [Paenibacillus sp. 1182]|nr:hypothetical protein [Paenibacillus sp. 1182]MBP1309055.1 hypothetical protein [Paenibacillus sp. 1182]